MIGILPPMTTDHSATTCGICESRKTEMNGAMFCPHCDIPCKPNYGEAGGGCGICRAGMKGLSDRGTKWPDGKPI